jgi:hypothetical protein
MQLKRKMQIVAGWTALIVLGFAIRYLATLQIPQPRLPSANPLLLGLMIGIFLLPSPLPLRGGRNRFIWIVVLLFGWFAFSWYADSAANKAFQDPNPQFLRQYAQRSLEFLIFVFLWIIAFPENECSTNSKIALYSGRVLAALVGVLAAGLWGHGLYEISERAGYRGALGLGMLQVRLVNAACILYILLVLRKFLPKTLTESGGWPALHRVIRLTHVD